MLKEITARHPWGGFKLGRLRGRHAFCAVLFLRGVALIGPRRLVAPPRPLDVHTRDSHTLLKHGGRGKNIPDCGYEDRQILRALACRDVKGGCPFPLLRFHGGAVISQLSEI